MTQDKLSPKYSGRFSSYLGSVHSLVMENFKGPRPKGLVVNHIDGDKTNNSLDNLEWVTYKQNSRHAYDTGLSKGAKGEENSMSKLTASDILKMYEMFVEGKSNFDIAILFNVHDRYVSLVRHGKRWKHLYKGPYPKSNKPSAAVKTTLDQVLKIRELAAQGFSNIHISHMTGVEKSTVSRIKSGKLFKSVN